MEKKATSAFNLSPVCTCTQSECEYTQRVCLYTDTFTYTGEQLNTELLQVYPCTCTQTKPWISSKAWAIQCNKKGLLTAKCLTNGRLCPKSAITPRNWGIWLECALWTNGLKFVRGRMGFSTVRRLHLLWNPICFIPRADENAVFFHTLEAGLFFFLFYFLRIQILKTIVSSQHFQSQILLSGPLAKNNTFHYWSCSCIQTSQNWKTWSESTSVCYSRCPLGINDGSDIGYLLEIIFSLSPRTHNLKCLQLLSPWI